MWANLRCKYSSLGLLAKYSLLDETDLYSFLIFFSTFCKEECDINVSIVTMTKLMEDRYSSPDTELTHVTWRLTCQQGRWISCWSSPCSHKGCGIPHTQNWNPPCTDAVDHYSVSLYIAYKNKANNDYSKTIWFEHTEYWIAVHTPKNHLLVHLEWGN